MAKGRLIYIKISMSEQVNQLPNDTARLLYTWLLVHLDVEGRFYGDAQRVRSRVFPCRSDIQNGQVEQYLGAMEDLWLIGRYEIRGQKFLWVPKWGLFQTLRSDREAASSIPPPPNDMVEEVLSRSGVSPEELRVKYKIREGKLSINKEKIERQKYLESFCIKCNKMKDLCECEKETEEGEER